MGLAFNGADASWSYSGFYRFRVKLMKEIGFSLEKIWNHGVNDSFGESRRGFSEKESKKERNRALKSKDPILGLVFHSDCDGSLSPDDCEYIAPRLLELVQKWPEGDYDREQGELLVKGMKKCAKEGKPLIFC